MRWGSSYLRRPTPGKITLIWTVWRVRTAADWRRPPEPAASCIGLVLGSYFGHFVQLETHSGQWRRLTGNGGLANSCLRDGVIEDTSRSSTLYNRSPVKRLKTNSRPCLVHCATGGDLLAIAGHVDSAGAEGQVIIPISWMRGLEVTI